MKLHPEEVPFLVFADEKGQLFEDTDLRVCGRSGNNIVNLKPEDFIELPEGSDYFCLDNRFAIGYNAKTKKQEVCKKGRATAAFIAPAHTQTYLAAYEKNNESCTLPLYAYSVLGWYNNKFYTTALRIDNDIRQDCNQFYQPYIEKNVKRMLKANKENRLLKHIAHCATVYMCPAARNYFMFRWEAPLPTSPSCNSRCKGCISFQPREHKISATQNRITFIPTPEEIAQIAIDHIAIAPNPVVSFGQGCEGEPLLVWETIKESIKLIRKKTTAGIINLNTNGSLPNAVEELFQTGLDSIRVSMNSAQEELYNIYYQPKNYSFNDAIKSLEIARQYNKWASINYFVFPGVTDSEKEFSALTNLIKKTGLNMIQWRNFNIDPDWYSEMQKKSDTENALGVEKIIQKIKIDFPMIYHGYFNPGEEIIRAKKII